MNNHVDRKHAKLSASGSHRWLACPGSVIVEKNFPDTTSEFAEYGTAGHELAERCLNNDVAAQKYMGVSFNKTEKYPYGFEADLEMCDAVQTYVDYCNGLPGDDIFVEQRVDFSPWVPEGFGTADYIKVGATTDEKYIINCVDLKMGKGVKVFAEENSQGMLYALGVLNDLDMVYGFSDDDQVMISIVQPRIDHIDEWTTSVRALKDWAMRVVKPTAKLCNEETPEFNPGTKQCKFCKAQATCKALAKHSLQKITGGFDDIPLAGDPQDVHLLSNTELSHLLKHVDTIVNWAKSLEATAFAKLELGEKVLGYKMVKGRAGNRKWVDDTAVIKLLVESGFVPHDFLQPKKLLTPPNMVKLLKAAGHGQDVIETLWTQPEGKPTIAEESDKREEIVPADVSGFDVIN
jgi:hypothetical protein